MDYTTVVVGLGLLAAIVIAWLALIVWQQRQRALNVEALYEAERRANALMRSDLEQAKRRERQLAEHYTLRTAHLQQEVTRSQRAAIDILATQPPRSVRAYGAPPRQEPPNPPAVVPQPFYDPAMHPVYWPPVPVTPAPAPEPDTSCRAEPYRSGGGGDFGGGGASGSWDSGSSSSDSSSPSPSPASD